MTETTEARRIGYQAGHDRATWVFDWNTDEATYRRVVQGIEDSDPEIMDMQPEPLSGEWAGESIPELSDYYGLDLEDVDIADAFEDGYSEGFWEEVEGTARLHLEETP